ncbi:DUF4918 family protein [Flavihumibacter sp. R14]|nr:DUF4918 family protein [Flavihumibacter soli]
MIFFAEKVIKFYQSLNLGIVLSDGIQVMHPHLIPEVERISSEFYRKFYSDNYPRTFIFGINPGRFGGGITGIPFTDPIKLESYCGITHPFKGKSELSADFIYQVISGYGGTEKFYNEFYFTSLSPLGYTRNGTNLNYYDDIELLENLMPLMGSWMKSQVDFGANKDRCICLGTGKNLRYLTYMNERYHFFERIDVLEHPRFIMQYRRKYLTDYISKYLEVLARKD